MLVVLLVVGTVAIDRPPQVHSALETLSTCSDIGAEECRFAAAWLKMGGDPAMPEVLKAAPGMTQAGQLLTISAVASMPGKVVLKTLGTLALDTRLDGLARSLALDRLARRDEPKRKRRRQKGPLDFALSLVQDADATVRQAAVRLIADRVDNKKNKKLVDVIVAAFKDSDGGVRSEAVNGVRFCDCQEAPPILEAALKDEDNRVRRAAIEGLAAVKSPVVIPRLVSLMSSYDQVLNKMIARALRFQSGKAFGEDAEEWRAWLAQNQ